MRNWRIFKLHAQHVFQYRLRNFIWFLNSLINPLVLLMFWKGVLQPGETQNNWNSFTIQSYYLILIIAQSLLIHHVELMVAFYEIKRGNLVQPLLKPYSYVALRFISEVPWRLIQGFYGLVSVLILTTLFNLEITLNTELTQLIATVIVIILAFFLSFITKMLIGILAFWVINLESVLETLDIIFIAFAGLILPLNLFPQWLSTIAHFTPYPYMLYYPISFLIGIQDTLSPVNVIFIQIALICIFSLTYQMLWNQGVKKFSGVGR